MCLLAMVLVVMRLTGALAQSGCTSELTSLYPCLSYVTGTSSKPSSTCCSQLAGVVSSKPQCLCLLLNGGGSSVGININQTLALSLPGACQLQTPPSSKCNAAGNVPTSSTATPATSPPADPSKGSPDTPKIPSVSDTPAGNGSKTAPATDGSTSAGSNTNASFPLTALFLFVASCVLSGAGF
ncbi:non-specific lipid transfer protein GPI-anchored 15-like isoform X1 [Coffea arabica]|uniref:Non-specific lipid transfer protein GPI-anchored 15-like isoform X1 n=1 Tax=Coffea arabica TaxID=13443 RepID=A0ABM4UDC4_COFAR